MTYEAAEQTARDLISVHGREAIDVAMTCVRTSLRSADPDAVHSWLEIFESIRSRLE